MALSIDRFCRIALWTPVFIPPVVMLGVATFGLPISLHLHTLVFAIVVCGVYGTVPYLVFALWANRWIAGRSETEIRRMAICAPALMFAAFVPIALVSGAANGDAIGEGMFLMINAVLSVLLLGYAYVALICGLRRVAQARNWIATVPGAAG